MNLFTYRLLTSLALPLIAYSGWKRCRKQALLQKKQPSQPKVKACFRSRFGLNPQPYQIGGIWIHAVSVGETRSIFPLLSRFKQAYPTLPLTVTNGSTQGALQALQFSPVEIQHQMIPYDFSFAVNRFLDQIQPKLVVMVETEIWPNLYQACAERNIPIILINARLKERSFLSYQKWGGGMLANALNQTQFIAAQFPIDAEYFAKLGTHTDKIKTLGNLKFDLEIEADLIERAEDWKRDNQLNKRFIWVAASTHAHPESGHNSEEQLMCQAHKQLIDSMPDVASPPLLIIVPRHADRFDEVAAQIQASGLKLARRSLGDSINSETQVYLADSVGELMLWFAACDAAFIGGSLVPFGGHNILEPAVLSKAVLSGPHFRNLQALYDTFSADQALSIVQDTTELRELLTKLASRPELARELGQQAFDSFNLHSGALDKLLEEIKPLLKE
ncbi:MAG: 3-deoxy-D-manno-octulosonic-acid transferase [Thiomicrorhabdus sp.]|nr:MAG: 3-deoxy-D-manno-octulosonic-acid transferase [Thiomicrorhabdus sp.]